LDDPRSIAKVDERETAEIATPMYPSPETNPSADVIQAQRAAEVRTMGCRERIGAHLEG
jgi:hypothetical protein